MSAELVVSFPDEVSRQMLEREATLLDSVERETECEAVTEREDTYEVIIDTDGELKSEQYSIGMYILNYNWWEFSVNNVTEGSDRR